jgi:hypothetical protein
MVGVACARVLVLVLVLGCSVSAALGPRLNHHYPPTTSARYPRPTGTYHGAHGFRTLSHHRAIMKRPHGWELLNLPRYPKLANTPRFQGVLRWLLLRPRALLPQRVVRWLGRLVLACLLGGAGFLAGYYGRS